MSCIQWCLSSSDVIHPLMSNSQQCHGSSGVLVSAVQQSINWCLVSAVSSIQWCLIASSVIHCVLQSAVSAIKQSLMVRSVIYPVVSYHQRCHLSSHQNQFQLGPDVSRKKEGMENMTMTSSFPSPPPISHHIMNCKFSGGQLPLLIPLYFMRTVAQLSSVALRIIHKCVYSLIYVIIDIRLSLISESSISD